MAVTKRKGKAGNSYQVKVRGTDKKWVTDTFKNRAEAEKRHAELVVEKSSGGFVTNLAKNLTVEEYFRVWSQENVNSKASEGWKGSQHQMFRDYVNPVIGSMKVPQLNAGMIQRVLNRAAQLGRAESTLTHIYGLMHKMFGDAVELYNLVPRNPVIRKLRPKIPMKESNYLEVEELVRLIQHVEGKRYQVAIWLQLLVGMRVGEVQFLTWENVDLKYGVIHIKGTYRRKEKKFHDVPKGKKWHRVKMPPELWELLRAEKERSASEYVVKSPKCEFMTYISYVLELKKYCKEAGVPEVSTHGLRHSTAELYMANGASRDDLRILFAHSTNKMTDRYVHDKGRRLDQVAGNVILFRPKESRPEQFDQGSQNVPKGESVNLEVRSDGWKNASN